MASRSDIQAGRAYVELSLKSGAFNQGLKASGEKLKSWGSSMAQVGAIITAAGAAIKGVLTAAILKFAESGDKIEKMSRRTGIGTNALSELGFAAEQSGQGLETLESSLKKMQKTIGGAFTGNKENIDSLRELGISLDDLKGKSPDQQFEQIADAISKVQDPTMRAAMAMKIFGRSGTDLIPLMEDGAEGIRKLRKEARDLGLSKSPEAAKMAASLTEAFNRVHRVIGSIVNAIGSALAPAMLEVLAIAKNVLIVVGQWVRENKNLFVILSSVATGLIIAGTALTGFGLALTLSGVALTSFASALGVIGSLLGALLSPFALIATAIGGAVFLWAKFTDSGQAAVSGITALLAGLAATVKETFGGIFDALKAGDFALAGKIAIDGLRVAMLQGLVALSTAISGTFGDMLATIGAQIAGGNFSGAWSTVVMGMAKIWSDFSAGVVSAFTAAAKSVLAIWQPIVEWIANRILELDNLTGGTIAKEQERAEKLRAETKQQAQARLSRLEGIQKSGDLGDFSPEQLAREIDDAKKLIAKLSSPANVLNDAQRSNAQQISGMRAGANKWLDDLNKQAQENQKNAGDNFRGGVAGGNNAAQDALDKAQKDLDDARKAAADAADKAKADGAEKAKPPGGAPLDPTKMKAEVFSTFSGAALAAAGAGGGNGNPVVAELKKQDSKADKRNNKLIAAIEQAGVIV